MKMLSKLDGICLQVYAFLAPTRAVVGTIVREKELRLREGMLMLGLTVGARRQCL